MIEIWDYFMRRKGLLLAVLAVFLVSSILSYQAFRGSAVERPTEYISIKSWGDTDVEVPHTGTLQPVISVMSPRDLVSVLTSDNLIGDSENSLDIASEEILADNFDEYPDDTSETFAQEPEIVGSEPDLAADEATRDVEPAETIENVTFPATAYTAEHNITAESNQNQLYLVFLAIIGIATAAALVYFSEQHFLR